MKNAIIAAILALVVLGLWLAWVRGRSTPRPSDPLSAQGQPAEMAAAGAPATLPPGAPAAAAVVAVPPAGEPATLNPREAEVRVMLAGPTPDDWEPLLMKLVETGDSNTVAALAQAMGTETNVHQLTLISRVLNGIGTEESLQVFIDFLSDERNTAYREHLAGTLLALENEELSGTVLDWMAKTMDYDITMACQEAVGRLATAEVVERIIAEHSRTNCNEYVLELMRTSLAASECPEAMDLFKDVLAWPVGRPSVALQSAAAQALANIGTQPAIDILIDALRKSTRSPTNDFLVDAMLGLQGSYMQAYLQEQFDRATEPNVKYALGRVLAETIPMLKDYSEEPPPGEEEPPAPAGEVEDAALPLHMGADEGEWEEVSDEESDESAEEDSDMGEETFPDWDEDGEFPPQEAPRVD